MFLWAVCMSAIKVMLHQSDQNVPIEMSYGNISEKYLDMHYKVYVSLTVATNLTWTERSVCDGAKKDDREMSSPVTYSNCKNTELHFIQTETETVDYLQNLT